MGAFQDHQDFKVSVVRQVSGHVIDFAIAFVCFVSFVRSVVREGFDLRSNTIRYRKVVFELTGPPHVAVESS